MTWWRRRARPALLLVLAFLFVATLHADPAEDRKALRALMAGLWSQNQPRAAAVEQDPDEAHRLLDQVFKKIRHTGKPPAALAKLAAAPTSPIVAAPADAVPVAPRAFTCVLPSLGVVVTSSVKAPLDTAGRPAAVNVAASDWRPTHERYPQRNRRGLGALLGGRAQQGIARGGTARTDVHTQGASAEVVLRRTRFAALRRDHPAPRVLPDARRTLDPPPPHK